jgi:uncharacterized protein with GYD domain
MVRFLSTLNFTVQGIRDLKHSTTRADEFRADVEKSGGRVLFQYWAVGDMDGCFVFEAPSDQVATQLLMRLEQQGNVRTKTIRVFDEKEFSSIAAGI